MAKFKAGDKVRIYATKSSSVGVKEHDGEIATIKGQCSFFSKAYYLEEFGCDHLWHENCLKLEV